MKTKKIIATLLIASAGATLIAPIGTFALENKTILSGIQTNESDIVSIPDENFKTLLNNALGQPAGSQIKKSDLEKITEIYSNGQPINSLEGIQYCKNLNTLKITSNGEINDLNPLSELINLNYLEIQSNKITDITPLGNLKNLQQLYLQWNQITDITPISNLNNLKRLELEHNKITDIPNLENMKSLTMLNLNNNTLNDLTPITTAPYLEDLSLGSIGISDLSPLSSIKTLKDLYYCGNEVTDISPLSKLINLTDLSLDVNKINDLTPLKNLTNLTFLTMSRNEISDLSPLENLNKLNYLWADYNKIENIDIISNMPELTDIRMNFNKINNLTPLESLTKLQWVGFENNEISDISSLSNLTNLSIVILNNNNILNLSPLNNLTKLQTLEIDNQKIENSIESTGRFATTTDIAIDVDGNPIKPKNISENGIIKDNKLLWRNINSDTICDYSYDTTIKIGNISTRFTANATSEIKYNKGKSPVIHGADNIEIKKGSEFNPMEGVYYTDEDEAPNSKIHVIGEVDTNIEGNYTLIYTVTDSWGNNTTFYREVFVV